MTGDGGGRELNVTDFSGMVYRANGQQMVLFGGGHASTNNDSLNVFSVPTLTWSNVYPPTPLANWVIANCDFARGAWLGPSPRWRRQSRFFSPTVQYVLEKAPCEVLIVAFPQGVIEAEEAVT